MRVDTKPFDDIRVRRALNMAVNKQEIVSALLQRQRRAVRLPQHPDYTGYFEPLEADAATASRSCSPTTRPRPRSCWPRRATPTASRFKVQVCSCSPDHMDLLPLVAAYLEKVGVKIEIQPMEYGAFLSAMTTQDERGRLLHEQRPHQPDHHHPQELHHGQVWNPSQYSDPDYDKQMDARLPRARRGQAPGDAQADDARDPRQGALHLAADAAHLSRRGGRG